MKLPAVPPRIACKAQATLSRRRLVSFTNSLPDVPLDNAEGALRTTCLSGVHPQSSSHLCLRHLKQSPPPAEHRVIGQPGHSLPPVSKRVFLLLIY
ncbi:MAG: hypothetical protein N3D16_12550, partial [Anaerolineales bacterium]|nr:hypothetical protein [Anaerolineales bacterium]